VTKPGLPLLGLRSWIFVAIARISSHLPAFKGRTRIFLLLHQVLGLTHQRILVHAKLRKPIPYFARLDLQSWLQRIAFLTGAYEGETVNFLRRLSQSRSERGYLLDIGANIGMITVPFAMMARDGASTRPSVVAVEAVPDNTRALEINIKLNQLDGDVTVIGSALGDVEKIIQIQVEGDLLRGEGSGTANILADDSTYACVTQSMRLLTLDGLLESGVINPECAVIKIDTDGYDLKVLQGGIRFLAASRPVIFGEFSAHCLQWHQQSIVDVIAFAESQNYRLLYRQDGSIRFDAQPPAGGFRQDLLLIPFEHEHRFSWCSEPMSKSPTSSDAAVPVP
jgi:FkbM family methyltransferase